MNTRLSLAAVASAPGGARYTYMVDTPFCSPLSVSVRVPLKVERR